jgi:anti-sigma regulatory factor (Ser/Thr protein kinase)
LAGFGLDTEAEHGLVVAVNEAATNSVEHAYRVTCGFVRRRPHVRGEAPRGTRLVVP